MSWKKRYGIWAIGGFGVVSLFGVLLRLMFVSPITGIDYTFFLHAHSHFAFSGWIFLAISLLIGQQLHGDAMTRGFKIMHLLTLISAFGMLVSFSFQGYKAISISFSTLFIFTNFYFTALVLKDRRLQDKFNPTALKMLKASLFFLCFSAAGPFALGPMMAAGLKGTPLYHDAIYFYLHMQMNGWMLLAVLALVFNRYNISFGRTNRAAIWLNIFIWSTLPLYLIFTLWHSPSPGIKAIALLATLLNCFGWLRILISCGNKSNGLSLFLRIAMLAVSAKVLFQILICFPSIGNWVFSQRNLIIGYIHLLMLGCITLVILEEFRATGLLGGKQLQSINRVFVTTVFIYIILLFLQPFLALFSIPIPAYQQILLSVSVLFLLLACLYFRATLSFKADTEQETLKNTYVCN